MIPLYRDELEYKLTHDAQALLDKMDGISFVVEPDRQDAITRGTLVSGDNEDHLLWGGGQPLFSLHEGR